MDKIIVTGSPETEDQAIEWLRQRGAEVSQCQGVTIIALPEDAILEKLAFHWQYALTFGCQERNEAPNYVVVDLDVDARKTILKLDSLEDVLVETLEESAVGS